MILRRRLWRAIPSVLSVLVACLLLSCALAVRGDDEPTLAFLQNFRAQISHLNSKWPASGSDYCSWSYITCDPATNMARLELSNLGLEGKYPQVNDVDGSQIRIEYINMSFNPRFKASLRNDWYKLTHLRVLDLSSTATKGDLPSKWGGFENLQFLNLSNTNIENGVPEKWNGLQRLVTLDLHNTEVDEFPVSDIAADMTSLEVLLLGATKIPRILKDLTSPSFFPNLRVLDVSNPVDTDTKTLPPDLSKWAQKLPSLTYVGFEGFGFKGCVPDSYRPIPALMQAARRANIALVMNPNKCSRYTCQSPTKPDDDTMTFLRLLRDSPFMREAAYLWSNETNHCSWRGILCPETCGAGIVVNLSYLPLTGSIPDVFDGLDEFAVQVDGFVVSGNPGLVGVLPSSLAKALSLARAISIISEKVIGTLPAAFGASLPYLEYLDISNTHLCGPLPSWGSTLPPLRYVNLSNNRLGGPLDASWSELHLKEVHLKRNGFCGCVPASWKTQPSLLASLDDSALAAGLADDCALTNCCGNANQQCAVTAAKSPTENDTLQFLLTLSRGFPAQLFTWGRTEDYCDGTWRGLTCNTVNGTREVIANLYRSGLTGTLPELPASVVGSRVLVATLNMSTNSGISGNLPTSWGRLSYLRRIDLSHSSIQCDLPDAWEGMSSLSAFAMRDARLCRGLPNWHAANMPKLRHFDVQSNWMYGGLSDSFGSFSEQLYTFKAEDNNFCDCIPTSWGDAEKLKAGFQSAVTTTTCRDKSSACTRFRLSCDAMRNGIIDYSSYDLMFLKRLRESLSRKLAMWESDKAIEAFRTWVGDDFCSFAGVTCSFHSGSNGITLNLSGMGLKGSLPSLPPEYSNPLALRRIDLSDNPGITGTLPPSWRDMTNLQYLNLSNTSVRSAIPTSWQDMDNLRYLSLAHTQVCGPLPAWSADKLASIQTLDFSHAELAGTLSSVWGTFAMSDLSQLRLEGNAGLCVCAPPEWLEGNVLPTALLSAFNTLPEVSKSCASKCAAPPSCVNPEDDGSGDDAVAPHGIRALHLGTLLVVCATLFW